MNLKSLRIVVPVYNEAASLPILLPRLEEVATCIEAACPVAAGFVFVDDGSTDDSFALLQAYDFGRRPARLLQFSRNFGKEAALSAGIDAAEGADAAVLMDADLQHPPEMMLHFVRIWLTEGVDSVYAYKASRRSEGLIKRVFAWIFYRVINMDARYRIAEHAGDFRLTNRRFMDALRNMPESQRFMKGLYGWIGFRQVGLPFNPPVRTHGVSHYTPWRLSRLTLDAMTCFTTSPLRVMALAGLLIAALSAVYGIFIVIEHFLFPSTPPGIASALTLTAFFGGVQMMFLGLLGEYVGKAVLEAKKRPSYIVAEDMCREGTDGADRG